MAIIFDVGFKVDSAQVASSLDKISRDINSAYSKMSKEGPSKELTAAVKSAEQLKTILSSATTSKGTSMSLLLKGLEQSKTSAAQMVGILTKGGMNESANALCEALGRADNRLLGMNAKLAEMARVFKQSAKFTLAQTALRGMSSALHDSVQWSKQLNSIMTDIQIVTNKTAGSMEAVYKNTIKAAQELKIAAKDYAEASLIFYQQGLSDKEVAARSATTVKSAKVTGSNTDNMSEQLTAIWNTYQMTGKELERSASVAAKLGAETAVDFGYIAEAMQNSANAASAMGVEYDSLAAIIATVGSTTQQSASVVGNAYKTIFSRMEQLKISGTDGEVTLNKVSSQLQAMGVNILDTSGQLRDLDSIIMELGNSWETYSKKEQIAIAEAVGGTRQYTQFLALMQNFDKYKQNLSSAKSENGDTLNAQYNTYINNSISALKELTSEKYAQIFSNIFSDKNIKIFYKGLLGIASAIEGISKALGGLPGILGLIGMLLSSKLTPALDRIKTDVVTTVAVLPTAQKATEKLANSKIQPLSTIGTGFQNAQSNYLSKALGSDTQDDVGNKKLEAAKQLYSLNTKINASKDRLNVEDKGNLEIQQQVLSSLQAQLDVTLDLIKANQQNNQTFEKKKKALDIAVASDQSRNQARADAYNERHPGANRQANPTLINEKDADLISQASAEIEKFTANVNNLDQSNEEAEANFEAMTQKIKEIAGDTSKASPEVQNFMKQLETASENAKPVDALNDYKNAFDSFTASMEPGQNAPKAVKTALDDLNTSLQKNVDGFIQATNAQDGFQKGLQKTEEELKKANQASATTASSFARIASGALMIYNQASSLGEQIGSGGESVAQILTTIVGIVVALIPLAATLATAMGVAFWPVLAIAAVIAGIVVAIKAYQASLEAAAKKANETAEKTRELSASIEENTKTVQDNVDAWKNALETGEDVNETFNTMKESIDALNASFGNDANLKHYQDELEQLATKAYATGDFTEYYQKVAEAQAAAFEQGVLQTGDANVKTLKAAANNTTRTSGTSSHIDEMGNLVYDEEIDVSSTANFIKSYQDLQQKAIDATKAGNTQLAKSYTNLIDKWSETYDTVTQNVAEVTTQINSQFSDAIAKDVDTLDEADFATTSNYLSQMASEVQRLGTAAGMSGEQIESLFRSITGSNPDLARTLALMDQINQITGQTTAVANIAAKEQIVSTKTDQATEAQKIADTTHGSNVFTGMGTYLAGVGKAIGYKMTHVSNPNAAAGGSLDTKSWDEFMSEASSAAQAKRNSVDAEKATADKNAAYALRNVDRAQAQLDKAKKDAEAEAKAIEEFYNGLSKEDQTLMLKVNVDYVDDAADLKEILEGRHTIEREINVSIRSTEDNIDTINDANSLRDTMRNAAKEQYNDGGISVDTASDLAAQGHADWVIKVGDAYKLTQEAVDQWNGSIENQNNALEELTGTIPSFVEQYKAMAIAGSDFAATIDNETLAIYGNNIMQLGIDAANGKISMDDYFSGLNTNLDDLRTQLESGAFDEETLKRVATFSGDIGIAIASTMTKATEAVRTGQMTMTEYTGTLRQSAVAAKKLAQQTEYQARAEYDLISTKIANNEATEAEIERHEELGKIINESMQNYRDLDNSIASLDGAEKYVATLQKNASKLQEIFEDDFTLKNLNFDSISAEANAALEETYNAARSWLQGMSDIGAEALAQNLGVEQTLVERAMEGAQLSAEEMASVVGGASQYAGTVIGDIASNIGTILDETQKLITNFEAEISVTPEGSIGFKGNWNSPLELAKKLIMGEEIKAYPTEDNLLFKVSGGATGDSAASISKITEAAKSITSDVAGMKLSDYVEKKEGSGLTDDGTLQSGGGGGGNKNNYKQGDQYERYVNNLNKQAKTAEKLKKLSNVEDGLYGNAKLAALQKKSKLLQEQAQDYQRLYTEAKGYYELDLAAARSDAFLISAGGVQIQDGKLVNEEQLNNALTDLKNKINDTADDAAKEALQKQYDAAERALSNLKDSIDKQEEYLENAIEQVKSWIDNKLSELTYRLEIKATINERELTSIEYALQRLGTAGTKAGQGIQAAQESLSSLGDLAEEQRDTYDNLYDLFETLENGGDLEGNKTGAQMFGADVWKEMVSNGTAVAQVIEKMNEVTDQMLETAKQMDAQIVGMWQSCTEALQAYLADFEELETKTSNQATILDTWISLWDATGDKYKDAATYMKMLEKQTKVTEQAMNNAESKMWAMEDSYNAAENAYQSALAQYNRGEMTGEQLDAVKAHRDECLKSLNDATNEYYSSVQDHIAKITEMEKAAAEQIVATWQQGLSGGLLSTEGYSDQMTMQNYYLDDYEKGYGLTKLSRQVEDAMDGLTDPARMKQYQEYLDDINEKMADGVKLTQTDVDIMQAKLELMKKQDELEDARNAKNTMKLTRDASGNYSYVYSGEDTTDQEQAVDDAYSNWYELVKNAADTASQEWYNVLVAYQEFEANIDQTRLEHDEAYKQQVAQKREYFTTMMANYASKVDEYNADIDRSYEDTAAGVMTGCDSMTEAQQQYTADVAELTDQLKENHDSYQEKIDEVSEKFQGDCASMSEAAQREMEKVDGSLEEVEEEVVKLQQTTSSAMIDMTEKTQRWCEQSIGYYNQLIAKIQELYEAQTQLNDMDVGGVGDGEEDANTGDGDWVKSKANGKWWWGNEDTRYAYYDGWAQLDWKGKKSWYYFDGDGYMLAGCFTPDGYYVGADGAWDGQSTGQSDWKKATYRKYATGGYTGNAGLFGVDSIPAMLAPGEYVLNDTDTAKILEAVKLVRNLEVAYKDNMDSLINQASMSVNGNVANAQELEQNVHIDASFPNVSVASEIEEAFNNLVNETVQYISGKR